jgi:hypothetical protein
MATSIIVLLSVAVVLLVISVALLLWSYMRQNDEIRRKNDVIVREVRRNQELIRNALLMLALIVLLPAYGIGGAQGQDETYGSPVALRTNLLYDAALIPNLGVEVNLGRQWTVGADYVGTWFSSDNRHRYWQCYGGYVTLRRYFGSQVQQRHFTGHHIGVYGLGLTYDVEFGGRGYQAARFGFGGGVEYGWSARIARRLNIDLSIGLGFQGGKYKKYVPQDGQYLWCATENLHWWGPTRAEVSLKWLLGGNKTKKGGSR